MAGKLASAVKMTSSIANRFQGCLVGAAVGDCLGSPFEGFGTIDHSDLKRYFSESLEHKLKIGQKIDFTDDTAMTRSVAASLIANKGYDAKDMASRFVEEYYREPGRGYGATVVNVFSQLREEKCADPYGPAKLSFDGQGSGGNGAAMRIAPVGLYGYKLPKDKIIELAESTSKITHSHLDGVNSGVLQCLAVHQALTTTDSVVDVNKFIEYLCEEMNQRDGHAERRPKSSLDDEPKPFCAKLTKAAEYLKESSVPAKTVVETLGNNVLGLGSVPTAIYCFLRAQTILSEFETDNPFERTIQLAVSLGGDTDTIASMAGAIAGSFWGLEKIPNSWQSVCETMGIQEAIQQADNLYKLSELS